MTITLNHDRDYMTRDGRDVRILVVDAPCVFGGLAYPIIGCIGKGLPCAWREDGHITSLEDKPTDIIERPRKFRHEWWVNVYHGPVGHILYHSKALADAEAIRDRIACVKIVIEGAYGEGL